MDKKMFEGLVGRAMTDKSFRENLLKAPEETLRKEGYPVDAELINSIKRVSQQDAEALVSDFESQFATSTSNTAA